MEKQYGDSTKNILETELPHDPTILILGMYPKVLTQDLEQIDICTPMYTAALLTTAKRWKPPKCPSSDKWINTMWCVYTKTYWP